VIDTKQQLMDIKMDMLNSTVQAGLDAADSMLIEAKLAHARRNGQLTKVNALQHLRDCDFTSMAEGRRLKTALLGG
jgi:hypothetical protein